MTDVSADFDWDLDCQTILVAQTGLPLLSDLRFRLCGF